MLTNAKVKGIRIIRAVIILPTVVTPVVVGLIWLLLYKHDFGLINFLLAQVGLPQVNWLTTTWGGFAATGTVLFIPIMILSLVLSKQIVRGLTFGAVKE